MDKVKMVPVANGQLKDYPHKLRVIAYKLSHGEGTIWALSNELESIAGDIEALAIAYEKREGLK